MHQKRLAAALRPDPLEELKRSLRPPSRIGGGKLQSVAAVWCPLRGRGGEKLKCAEWAEMNEKGYLKPDINSDFKFMSKCMFLRRAPQGDY